MKKEISKEEKSLEQHKDHPECGFFSSNIGLYSSPDGKDSNIVDFTLSNIGSKHLTRRHEHVIVELPCNLSNHGCKEKRRVEIQIKILRIWKPKRN